MCQLVMAFIAGALLFNAIPHLVQGICGKHHMTPFSKSSSPAVNIIWGWINMLLGMYILKAILPQAWTGSMCSAFCIGGFITSLFLAIFWTNPDARLPWHKK